MSSFDSEIIHNLFNVENNKKNIINLNKKFIYNNNNNINNNILINNSRIKKDNLEKAINCIKKIPIKKKNNKSIEISDDVIVNESNFSSINSSSDKTVYNDSMLEYINNENNKSKKNLIKKFSMNNNNKNNNSLKKFQLKKRIINQLK